MWKVTDISEDHAACIIYPMMMAIGSSDFIRLYGVMPQKTSPLWQIHTPYGWVKFCWSTNSLFNAA
jgi:hypothetical protein